MVHVHVHVFFCPARIRCLSLFPKETCQIRRFKKIVDPAMFFLFFQKLVKCFILDFF